MYFHDQLLADLERDARILRAMVKTIERHAVEAPGNRDIMSLRADQAELVRDGYRTLAGCLEKVGRVASNTATRIKVGTLGEP